MMGLFGDLFDFAEKVVIRPVAKVVAVPVAAVVTVAVVVADETKKLITGEDD
jgi:hypothetical protein